MFDFTVSQILRLLTLVCLMALATTLPAQDQTAGQLAFHSSNSLWLQSTSTNWRDVPDLAGKVRLQAGGDLAIIVGFEGAVEDRSTLYLRALVNDKVIPFGQVPAIRTLTGKRSVSYTFYAFGLQAGEHRVRIQWKAAGRMHIGDRCMVLRYAAPTSTTFRMTGGLGASYSIRNSGWQTVRSFNISCPWQYGARITVNIAGEYESDVDGKRVFVRALIDGKPMTPGDVVMTSNMRASGVRACTFVSGRLDPGNHTVTIQWMADSVGVVAFPVFTVMAQPNLWNDQTSYLHNASEGGWLSTTSLSYVSVPRGGLGYLSLPTRADLVIRYAAETYVDPNQSIYLRAFVDGKPVSPLSVNFQAGTGTRFDMREAIFVVRDVARGRHKIDIQWAVTGGTGYIADASLVVSSSTRFTLRSSGTPRPGSLVSLLIENPREAGQRYQMAAALSRNPMIPVPGVGSIPLAPDALFATFAKLPGVFQNFAGRLDGNGRNTTFVLIPNTSELRGSRFFCAYVTHDAGGIRQISNEIPIAIQ